MTEPSTKLRWNALTDPWLPLMDRHGATVWASPVEVLCGEKDGIDLDYPRDDFRIYARLLLSALVQALFPAKTKGELKQRIETPLTRADVEARIRPVLGDFDLFGPTPFLQITPPPAAHKKEKGAAPFVFCREDLFQPAVRVDAVSIPVALVTIFAEQAYAGGAGSGHSTGPSGMPGAFTLIDPGSVRRAAWANTLTLETAEGQYAPDEARAWSNAKRSARPRAAIGIVGGLFFQPRGIWLIPIGEGRCSFTGRTSALVRLSPFLKKSELTKKSSKGDDVWQHPCAPLATNEKGIRAVRLNTERPIWTGLAQLLNPISHPRAKKAHPLEGPAPVLRQWKNLGNNMKRLRLLVLDFDRDKANVKRRFFEAFPLTSDLLGNTDAVERLRS
ncbi:MAG: type I-E CRISPR-associated protein Cse1/CasA, partial [Polyangiaceae bacterium]|nr:type I-E CRISPR-associated protein Cse1/CasA [Polyangiaceae bacterium]